MGNSRRRSYRSDRNSNLIPIIILVVSVILLIVIYFVFYRNQDKNKKPSQQVPTVTEEATTEKRLEDILPMPTEVQTEAPTEPTAERSDSDLPEKTYGQWDLGSLSTEHVPFGNSADDTNEFGIPNGVFWYTNKWGQYNVDFVSDLSVSYTNGETTEKLIYLTMDCGFDNPETGPILDILKAKGVKATFFVTSMFYDARPDLVERMINEGHRIGSHSINHLDMTTLSLERQEEEIMDVVNKLKNDFNYDCRLFRFPEGYFSDETLALVSNLGLKSVFWTYAYNDFSTTQPPIDESYQKAVKYVHPGAIYLLHASSSTNRAFLSNWIDAVRAQGYEFAGVYPVD